MLRTTPSLFALTLVMPMHAQTANQAPSPRAFVANFYVWYTPFAQCHADRPAFELALRHKKHCFTPELWTALWEDAQAQRNSEGVIVRLDSDPFLMSQDPEPRYRVGKVSPKENGFLVEVHGVRSGAPSSDPAVIAEVRKRHGHWVFVNFHTPAGGGLLTQLKTLKAQRLK